MQSCSDTEVISFAARRRHVVLTFDLDYPMLLALHRETRTSAIIFRTSNAAHERINSRLAVCLPQAEHALKEGAIVVVEDDRLRVRRFIDL
jgi:predicted nuclease of predicted toxin-antitoxin system